MKGSALKHRPQSCGNLKFETKPAAEIDSGRLLIKDGQSRSSFELQEDI